MKIKRANTLTCMNTYTILTKLIAIVLMVMVAVSFIFLGVIFRRTQEVNAQSMELCLEATSLYVHQLTDNIDGMITGEILRNMEIRNFFSGSMRRDAYFDLYTVHSNIERIKRVNPLITHAYFYRTYDNLILSDRIGGIFRVEDFYDEQFIRSMSGISDKYTSFVRESCGKRVLTITKGVPIISGKQGRCVLDIDLQALKKEIDTAYHTDTYILEILDRNGEKIYSSNAADETLPITDSNDKSGWTFRIKQRSDTMIMITPALWIVWVVMGVMLLCLCAIYCMKYFRKNIAPLDMVSETLRAYFDAKNRLDGIETESIAGFLDSSIAELISEVGDYREKYEDGLKYRLKHFTSQLLDNSEVYEQSDFDNECSLLSITPPASPYRLVAIELDNASEISDRKQLEVYRFAVMRKLCECCDNHGVTHIIGWNSPKRLFMWLNDDYSAICAIVSNLRAMNISLTCAVSDSFSDYHSLSRHWTHVDQALNFRMMFPKGKLITRNDIAQLKTVNVYKYFQEIGKMCELLACSDDGWREVFVTMSIELQEQKMTRSDINILLHYCEYNLDERIHATSEELYSLYNKYVKTPCAGIYANINPLSDTMDYLLKCLEEFHAAGKMMRAQNSNAELIGRIKLYIDENIADSQLSLQSISEKFKINTSSFSVSFREIVGVKFINYVIARRIDMACLLLKDTNISIQEVGERVGYSGAIAFGRVFKKVLGLTPSEYRAGIKSDAEVS